MQRRHALRLLAATGVMGGAYAAVAGLDGLFSLGREGNLFSRTVTGMGTVVGLTVVDGSAARAEDAVAAAVAEMDRREAELTRFDAGAPVARLNETGRLDDVPASLRAVLRRAEDARVMSGGAFDVTVAPLLALYERSFARDRAPDAAEVREILALVGADKLRVADDGVRLARAGMGVTLDGVAKGWIVDAMAEVLRMHGIERGLVNAGGDIRAFGGRGAGQPWKIAVRNPEGGYAETFALTDGACATSGDYEVHYDKDKLFHHVVNPATGFSPRSAHSATVVAESAATADALSTALLVLGKEGEKRLAPYAARTVLLG